MKKCPKCGSRYEETTTLCPQDGEALVKTGDTLLGQTLAGKYRLDERVSEGGMGAVYRATHVLMEKTVAIKVLHPSLAADENIVARFSREARAASRINHPHAISVTDFGEDENGTVFLVMEYLRGQTLKELIRREGGVPLPRAVKIIKQISGALEAAHAQGVVHRDMKSDNVMLEEAADGDDWVKVLDFGIAKIQEPSDQASSDQDSCLTAPNLIIGTPQYMSPEQCSKTSEIDKRADVYALGVILYEMLAGQVPFSGQSPTEIMLKQMQEPAPSILKERGDLPPGVDEVIQKALKKKPEERFQTTAELSQALEQAAPAGTRSEGAGTHRIVITTGETAVLTSEDKADEATMVRPREMPTAPPPPPPAASFNPWKIAVPAFVLLLLGFGVFYAIQRNSQPETPAPSSLRSDPQGRPVESIAPPKGENERDLRPRAATANTNVKGDLKPTPAPGEVTSPEASLPALPEVEGPITVEPTPRARTDERQGEETTGQGGQSTPPDSEKKPETKGEKGAEGKRVDLDEPPPAPTPAGKRPARELPKLPKTDTPPASSPPPSQED